MNLFVYTIKVIIFYIFFLTCAYSETIDKITINGNDRISNKTIQMFANIELKDEITNDKLNQILKDLYETNFFDNVSVQFKNNALTIFVNEYPIIQDINYNGIKSKTLLEEINFGKLIREKSPYNNITIEDEKNRLDNKIKEIGYFNSKIEITVENLDNNLVNINFNIELGDKAKIKRISFIGNKIFKDNKLKRLIVSTEYKFWKFISGRKYLNPNLVEIDKRLLKNYYLNNGYYNVSINSSFAKIVEDENFNLIYNIDAGDKIFFNNINLNFPIEFDKSNFSSLIDIFKIFLIKI